MIRLIVSVALLLFVPALFAATTVSDDITSDTTWNAAGSPYQLIPNALFAGTDIDVRNGATLTIDAGGGNVVVEFVGGFFATDFDLVVGGSSGSAGHLVIKASSGSVTFKMKSGCNLRVTTDGSLNITNSSYTTTFQRFSSTSGENNPGAVIFEAGQTRSSSLRNCTFSYLGYDSTDGALYVKSSATYVPTLENLSFDNCNTSAIRMDGNGINVLKEGNVTLPLSVTNTTYALYLNAVTSTAGRITFPDFTTPDSPTFKLTGTNQVGDASNQSGWAFLDDCTFKCAASSKVQVVNGYVWGSSEARPTFQSDAGSPGYSDWIGLVDDSTTKTNVFGDIGPFAHVTVRNATTGIEIHKGSLVPVGGQQTTWRFPGLVIKKCSTGLRARTQLESNGSGYITVIEEAEIGDSTATHDCDVHCVLVDYGRVTLRGCRIIGSAGNGITAGTVDATKRGALTVLECRITDTATSSATTALNLNSCLDVFDVIVERTIIEGWRTGVLFTHTHDYTPTRSLTMRNSFISADASGTNISGTGINIDIRKALVCTVHIEDCTISGVNKTGTGTARGFWLQQLRSSSSMTVRRTHIASNTDFGVDVVSATNNTCQYTFEECSFTLNGDGGTDEGGILDRRTQSARVVASRCTFAGNSPRGATGSNATQLMLAENCYWNAVNGPTGGGGSGDAINANVDASPFLARPYIGWLIGGSPAGVSDLGVNNATGAGTYADQLHIIDDDAFAVKWTFASDFLGSTQSAYEIDIDDTSNFSSLVLNGSKTSSSSTDIAITPALSAGTIYYLRIRLWDAKDRAGPWYYHIFRTNSAPAQVGDTDRSPGIIWTNPATPTITDATPQLVFQRAIDADEDPLHFYVDVDTDRAFNTAALRQANSTQLLTNGAFEISTDSGATWLPFPATGAPQGQTILIRLTCPTNWPNGLGTLTDTTWYWRVRASDGFQYGTASSDFKFTLGRAYVLSGNLVDASGAAVNGATIKVAHNGSVLGTSGTTNASGDFSFTVADDLKLGDILVVFRDGGAAGTRATRITHFTGGDMGGLNLKYRQIRLATDLNTSFTNAAFAADDGVDADIMWSEATGLITIGGDTTNTYTVELSSRWDLTGHVTGFANDASLSVLAGGILHSSVGNISMNSLAGNSGTIEMFNNCLIEFEANSTTSGAFDIIDARIAFRSVGVGLTVNRGTLRLRSSTVERKVVANGNAGFIRIDSTSSAAPAVAVFEGVEFSHVGVEFEADGVCAAFNNCLFKDGLTTRHILWKSKDNRSVTTFRAIQFNHALTQGSQFNVEAVADSLVLNMVGCGGIRWGEGYDKNGGTEGDSLDNKVLWNLLPPLDPKATPGHQRILLQWSASAQTELSGFGYNVYRATSASGPWTKDNGSLITPSANPSYVVSSLTNGTTYWFYVSVDDSSEDSESVRARSAYVFSAPAAASLAALSPATAASTSVLALTVVGTKTHWDASATLTITGGSGITVNDKIVLSPTLMLGDATLSSATTTTWTVTAARNDVWGDTSYDESVTANLTVTANSNENRPTISFTNPNVSEEAHLELKLADAHAGPPFFLEVSDGVERRCWEGGA